MINSYWDFHNGFGSLSLFLSLPSCTIIDNAKVNEGFIWDSKKFVCLFCILVIVPKCYSSQGWTKVGDELDVYICIDGVSFHCDCILDGGTSYIFIFPDPSWSTMYVRVFSSCFTFTFFFCNLPLNCCLIILILLLRKSVWMFFNIMRWSSHHW